MNRSRGQVLLFSGVGMAAGGCGIAFSGLDRGIGWRVLVGLLITVVGVGYVVRGNVESRRADRPRG